jgi:hypothetical protein
LATALGTFSASEPLRAWADAALIAAGSFAGPKSTNLHRVIGYAFLDFDDQWREGRCQDQARWQ